MATEHAAATRRRLRNAGSYVLLTVLSAVILFPVYTTIVRAVSEPIPYLKSLQAGGGGLWPVGWDGGVFGRVFRTGDLTHALLLSTAVSLVIVVGQVVTSILAAYAFACLEFPLKRTMFALVVGTLLLPIEVTLVANIETVRDLGWFNSIQGLAAPFLAWAFGVFLMRQAFLGIPGDMQDAALLDGFSHRRFLFRIAVPICRPIIGSCVLISFLGAWNQYLWPRYAADQQEYQTIQVALRTLATREVTELNFAFAAAIVAAIPLVILLIAFQRQIIRGLTAGAVKG